MAPEPAWNVKGEEITWKSEWGKYFLSPFLHCDEDFFRTLLTVIPFPPTQQTADQCTPIIPKSTVTGDPFANEQLLATK